MKRINILTIICAIICLFSCSIGNEKNEKNETINEQTNQKAYLNINISQGRTILPEKIDERQLTYSLIGSKNGYITDFGQFSYTQLSEFNQGVEVGLWDFTLTAKKSDQKVLIGYLRNRNIQVGKNTLSFNLVPANAGTGDIYVNILTTKDPVLKVKLELIDRLTDTICRTNEVYPYPDDSSTEGFKSETSCRFNYINKGYYNLKISLFQERKDETPVNTRVVAVRVEPGCTSTGNIIFDSVNNTYSITFHLNGLDVTGDCILPTWYNGSTYINLPNEGDLTGDLTFYGWYDNPHGAGTAITEIGYNSSGHKEFWANTFFSLYCSELDDYLSSITDKSREYSIRIKDSLPNLADITYALENNPDVKVSFNLAACNQLESIPENAFKNINNLVGLTTPETVTSIGDNAFNGCSNLADVTVLGNLTSVGSNAFEGCESLSIGLYCSQLENFL